MRIVLSFRKVIQLLFLLIFLLQLFIAFKKLWEESTSTSIHTLKDKPYLPYVSIFFDYSIKSINELQEVNNSEFWLNKFLGHASIKCNGIKTLLLNKTETSLRRWSHEKIWNADFTLDFRKKHLSPAITFNAPCKINPSTSETLHIVVNSNGARIILSQVHNKGLTRYTRKAFIGSYSISTFYGRLENDTNLARHVYFEVSRTMVKRIPSKNHDCYENDSPSTMADFIFERNIYISHKIGCKIPAVNREKIALRTCNTSQDLNAYIEELKRFLSMSFDNFSMLTGIKRPCTYYHHEVKHVYDERYYEKKKQNLLGLRVGSSSNEIRVEEQRRSYVFSDFIADVGGYLGLLLGISAMTIYDKVIQYMELLISKVQLYFSPKF